MGQTSAKLAQPLEAQELLDQVCTALEHRAGKCGKSSVEVYKQATALRELSRQWSTWQQQAEQLQGHQVLAVAVALHMLTTHLQRCKHKLQQRQLVSLRTLSSRQQAAHVLRVLAAVREALANFMTAFKLAVLLSREPISLSGSTTQQQQPQQQQQQQQQQPAWEDLHTEQHQEWQQLQGAYTAPDEGAQSAAPGSGCGATPATKAAGLGCDTPQQQPRRGGPQGELPARSTSGSQHTGSQAPSTDGTAADAPAGSQSADLTATRAAAGDIAAGQAPAGQEDDECEGAALWDRSHEGWQDLMQRAWRGEEAAVLACAQELIHGGEFCLQDCGLARQLLRTVVQQQQQSCGAACLWLGQLSERGLGLPAPDYSDAAAWYGKGAELGHLECAQALAFYYEHGLGLVQDGQAAREWYAFAAEGGLAAAQNNLGQLILQQGSNCSRSDTAEALHWLQAAAEQGSAAAQFNLGVCHELGLSGQGRDVAAAEECYRQAGTAKAWLRVGGLCLQRCDSTAAKEAFAAAAEGGSAEALVQLARVQAGQWGLGGSEQQANVCELVSSLGSGSSSSLGRSANYSDTRKSSNSSSLSSLAMQATADSVLRLYQQAASAGSAEAQHVLACSAWGKGHVSEAMQLWHAAAAQGHGAALLHLAAVAEKGLQGVKQDHAAARACYAMAAACGCREGAAQLALLDQDAALKSGYYTLQVAW